MKKLIVFVTLIVFALLSSQLMAQDSLKIKEKNQHRHKTMSKSETKVKAKYGKVLEEKKGFKLKSDQADHDNDGIPNGQDPDYTGVQAKKGKGKPGFVDEDGDGVNDNMQDEDGDGIPNGQDPDYKTQKKTKKKMNGEGMGNNQGANAKGNRIKGNKK